MDRDLNRIGSSNAHGPLAGLRVLELARILAGPWCGQLLADLGAEVIKVERPGEGDDTRQWGPPFIYSRSGETLDAAYFHSCNRGKRTVAVDLTSSEGQKAIHHLASTADVLIENFKVGALTRYGLDAASLRALYPRLIYCSITGFGQTGPYAARAGYDFMIQAMGGLMSITGDPGGKPQKVGVAVADMFTGMYATAAILAALHRREGTGGGAHVDMALLDTQVAVLGNQALNWMASGVTPERAGNGHANLAPYQGFGTRDGDVIIAVGNDGQFIRLCELLKRQDLAADARFATNPGRVTNRAQLIPEIALAVGEWSSSDLLDGLEARGVPASPINRIDAVFADPQVLARGLQIEALTPSGETLPGLASPIVIDGVRAVSTRAAPARSEPGLGVDWLR